jgi:deoxyribonuclease V
MKINYIHPWNLTTAEAKEVQIELAKKVIIEDDLPEKINHVAGVDVAFENDDRIAKAAISILDFPNLELVEEIGVRSETTFPYVPGYLSFREIPPILTAWQQTDTIVDIILCDGQGLAHPRRFGLACHLGLILDLPTIGVAKSLFIGKHDPLGETRGSWVPLVDRGETIGAVVRTRTGVKPLYISIGHKISLPTAIDLVLECTPKYRLPETTRKADRRSKSEEN